MKTFLLILAVLAFWLPESALAQQATIPLVSTTPMQTAVATTP